MLDVDAKWTTEEISRQAKRFANAAKNRYKFTTTDLEDLTSHLTVKMLSLPTEKQSWPYVLHCIWGWTYDWARKTLYPVRYPKNFSGLMPTALRGEARDKLFSRLARHQTRVEKAKEILATMPSLIGGPLIDYLDGMTPTEIGKKWGISRSLVFQRINRFDKLVERKDIWQRRSEQTKSTTATSSPVSVRKTPSVKVMVAGR